jgi:hypothetical protein
MGRAWLPFDVQSAVILILAFQDFDQAGQLGGLLVIGKAVNRQASGVTEQNAGA